MISFFSQLGSIGAVTLLKVFHEVVLSRSRDLLQKLIFAPLAPNSGGRIQSPPELGDLGGIPGFMQEV